METVVRCRSIFASFGGIFLYYLLVLFCKKRRGHDLKHRWFHLLNLITSLLFARMKALQSFKCKPKSHDFPSSLGLVCGCRFLNLLPLLNLVTFHFPKNKRNTKKKKKKKKTNFFFFFKVKKNKWIRRKYP